MATTDLALPQIVEVLAPGGKYETGRLELRKSYGAVLANAKNLMTVNSAEDAEKVTEFGRLLQDATFETQKFFKVFKKQVDDIKAPILSAEHEDIDAYEGEKKRLGSLLTGWNKKVREEQEAADRKAREEAIRKAQEEALLRAIEVEAIDGTEAAEQVLSEPIMVGPVVTQSMAGPKPKGSVSTVNYRAKVTDLMALVKAVAEGKVALVALEANQQFLNNQAKQFKEAYSIPGTILDKSDSTGFRR